MDPMGNRTTLSSGDFPRWTLYFRFENVQKKVAVSTCRCCLKWMQRNNAAWPGWTTSTTIHDRIVISIPPEIVDQINFQLSFNDSPQKKARRLRISTVWSFNFGTFLSILVSNRIEVGSWDCIIFILHEPFCHGFTICSGYTTCRLSMLIFCPRCQRG